MDSAGKLSPRKRRLDLQSAVESMVPEYNGDTTMTSGKNAQPSCSCSSGEFSQNLNGGDNAPEVVRADQNEDAETRRFATALLNLRSSKRVQLAAGSDRFILNCSTVGGVDVCDRNDGAQGEDVTTEDECESDRFLSMGAEGRQGQFWRELESLREENTLLRHENEVCRLRARLRCVCQHLQEYLMVLMHRTMYGFQSEQIDSEVRNLVDAALLKAEATIQLAVDLPVVLLEYLPKDSGARKSEVSSGQASHSCTKMTEQEQGSNWSGSNMSDGEQNPQVSDGKCDGSCGHDRRCVVKSASPGFLHTVGAGSEDDLKRASWRSLLRRVEKSERLQANNLKDWLDKLQARFDRLQSLETDVPLGTARSTEWLEFVDMIFPATLRRKQGFDSIKGQMHFVPIFVADRLYILGVHSYRLIPRATPKAGRDNAGGCDTRDSDGSEPLQVPHGIGGPSSSASFDRWTSKAYVRARTCPMSALAVKKSAEALLFDRNEVVLRRKSLRVLDRFAVSLLSALQPAPKLLVWSVNCRRGLSWREKLGSESYSQLL